MLGDEYRGVAATRLGDRMAARLWNIQQRHEYEGREGPGAYRQRNAKTREHSERYHYYGSIEGTRIPVLDEFINAYVLPSTPNALSLGKLCAEQ